MITDTLFLVWLGTEKSTSLSHGLAAPTPSGWAISRNYNLYTWTRFVLVYEVGQRLILTKLPAKHTTVLQALARDGDSHSQVWDAMRHDHSNLVLLKLMPRAYKGWKVTARARQAGGGQADTEKPGAIDGSCHQAGCGEYKRSKGT